MKAFLLAAGKGTRLRPYTDHTPKCLIPIHGKPLLQIWVELLERHGINEVLVNLHAHAEQVRAWIHGFQPKTGVRIVPFYEKILLGSAGTLWHQRNFVAGEPSFLIAYADNLTDIDLSDMIQAHKTYRRDGGILTMGLFSTPNPSGCGIVSLAPDNRITSFVEKPENPVGNLANAGIYVSSEHLFDFFPEKADRAGADILDLGFDVIPRLIGRMFGYQVTGYIRDIGSPESYQAALREWPARSTI